MIVDRPDLVDLFQQAGIWLKLPVGLRHDRQGKNKGSSEKCYSHNAADSTTWVDCPQPDLALPWQRGYHKYGNLYECGQRLIFPIQSTGN